MGRIVLNNVTKSFGETQVIPPLDLTIEDGEFAVFVGPSGCGKSTLLRMIAGLEDLTSGQIEIDGEDVNEFLAFDAMHAFLFGSDCLTAELANSKIW